MRYLLIAVFLTFLFGCNENSQKTNATSKTNRIQQESPPSHSETEKGLLIIPGKRLGTLFLEKNASSVFDSLGKPDSGDAGMGKAISTWDKDDNSLLTLYTTTQMGVEDFARIKAIRSLSKEYKTTDHLGVASSIDALKRYYRLDPVGKFTDNGRHYFLYTTSKGIAFEIGMDQKCHGVLLYAQGTDTELFYIPIYPSFKKL